MNNARRKSLIDIIEQLEDLKSRIEDIQEDEQAAFDNLPDGLQTSERGEAMEEAISNLEYAVYSCDEAIGYIESAIE